MLQRKRLYFYIGLFLLSIGANSCSKKDSAKATVAPPVRVSVMTVGQGGGSENREYTGTVSSENSATVSFPIAGTISELYVKEGDKVNKGQILGKVKGGEYENAYNIARAQLAEAQDGYNRLKKLHDANALPDVKWVEIQQKLKQAENMAQMAQRTLDDAVLKSPSSGTVTRKYADIGQNVMPAEPIYEIVSVNDLAINISLGENEISEFNVGEKAWVSFNNSDGASIEGKVIQKSVMADPLTRSYTVKVSLPGPKEKILPGMIGTVTFENSDSLNNKKNVILPSGTVLLNHDNRWFVWVVKDSIANQRFVEVDELVTNGIMVTSGLNAGDTVIIEGMQKVGNGSRVTPLVNALK
ncbi:MAG: efflux RND transporter periplasmic adaptor subunit [Muribaculaceae bacterium]|nr:efflux RND transporter periplasmic adaptor subunit [Muribaculaceae bacterium]